MNQVGVFSETGGVSAQSGSVRRDSTSPSTVRRYSVSCYIYLCASAIATLGWFWLLAKAALRLWSVL
jgi:hypothetical protein